MTWMNRWDVQDAHEHYALRAEQLPNYFVAASVLHELMVWTDENSDGWPYWNKPSNAAKRLQEHLGGWRRRYIDDRDAEDLTAEELADAVRPVKAFLTRTANANAGRYPDHKESALNVRAWITEMTA